MTILVLSDSHSTLRFMRQCVQRMKPDAIIHLGDYFDDGAVLNEAFPGIPFYQVPGNCDRYRCPPGQPEILVDNVCGIRLYMTHGHRHQVKLGLGALLDCHREDDGLWVLNPGSSGYYGGSAGVLEIRDGKITDSRIVREADIISSL